MIIVRFFQFWGFCGNWFQLLNDVHGPARCWSKRKQTLYFRECALVSISVQRIGRKKKEKKKASFTTRVSVWDCNSVGGFLLMKMFK